ncbi:MAG: bifunctional DNA-formamidopyrimidine glycosylase/DNA-(apurinic or apyrimidinic site) lyase [Gammaproteobacteria bacterium]|nr:bifunctional DNA-formamidopyrimidine glycosylase/DNA-(apurinic or apyrimidinic site) lyase [Gammaproteobacteria bacterium]
MPELPEVETTRRGIEPYVVGQKIARLVVRNPHLRWRVPHTIMRELPGQTIQSVTRRAKYLLLATSAGTAILHLGMSGSLRVVNANQTASPHDHVDIAFDNGDCLRLRDPRRFGALLWTRADPLLHKLLKNLGPEPLMPDLVGAYLYQKTRGRKRAIRDTLLDSRLIAGIGNIYANEALFSAGIRPARPAGKISLAQYDRLLLAIRQTLERAIQAGGTTLRDFYASDGKPGYFQLSLQVYGREGEPCLGCQTPVRAKSLGQRTAFYCPKCQM